MLITIEGVDCSGKETQSKLLAQRLIQEGKKVARFSFPFYGTPTGKIVGRPYLGKDGFSFFDEGASHVDPYVASLYFAADRKYNLKTIQDALKENDVVILDRYIYSNMAHQGCKLEGKEQEKFFDFIDGLEFKLLELPKPDVSLFLFVPCEIVEKLKEVRKERPDDHEKDSGYLKKAEQTYLSLVKKFGLKQINCVEEGKMRLPEDIALEVYSKTYE